MFLLVVQGFFPKLHVSGSRVGSDRGGKELQNIYFVTTVGDTAIAIKQNKFRARLYSHHS